MVFLRAGASGLFLCAALLGACAAATESTGTASQEVIGEFTDLTKAELDWPENLGRPLTAADITVVKGYDGKTPEEVAKIIRANFTGTFDRSYEAFFRQRTLDVHKQWTLVISNAFAKDFPAAKFVETVASEGTKVFIVGTPRGDIFLVTSNPDEGEQWYLAKGNSFEPLAVAGGFKPFTPPIARAELRIHPPGIRIEYPAWEWKPLGHPTEIEEINP